MRAAGGLVAPRLLARALVGAGASRADDVVTYVVEERAVECLAAVRGVRAATPRAALTAGRLRLAPGRRPAHLLAAMTKVTVNAAVPLDVVVRGSRAAATTLTALAKVAAAELGADVGVHVIASPSSRGVAVGGPPAAARSPHGVSTHGVLASAAVLVRKRLLEPRAPTISTALVTGGSGAVGSRATAWLAARGARRVVCAGRSGAPPAALVAAPLNGFTLVSMRADTGMATDAADAARAATAVSPLRAVLHAGGVLADAALAATTPSHMRAACAAKGVAATRLRRATAAAPVAARTALSSVAGLLGSAGQAAYAVANGLLDEVVADWAREVREESARARERRWVGKGRRRLSSSSYSRASRPPQSSMAPGRSEWQSKDECRPSYRRLEWACYGWRRGWRRSKPPSPARRRPHLRQPSWTWLGC